MKNYQFQEKKGKVNLTPSTQDTRTTCDGNLFLGISRNIPETAKFSSSI